MSKQIMQITFNTIIIHESEHFSQRLLLLGTNNNSMEKPVLPNIEVVREVCTAHQQHSTVNASTAWSNKNS
jgi:hypothetical protein